MKEGDTDHYDVIKTPSGNKYVVVISEENRFQFYIGNDNPKRIDTRGAISERKRAECERIGRIVELSAEAERGVCMGKIPDNGSTRLVPLSERHARKILELYDSISGNVSSDFYDLVQVVQIVFPEVIDR